MNVQTREESLQARRSGKASRSWQHGRNGSVSYKEATMNKDEGLGVARHEPAPQEFQVSLNQEETRLGRSLDSSRRVLNTTDSEAVALWAISPSGNGTQGEAPKTFSGERAGSDLSSAGRC